MTASIPSDTATGLAFYDALPRLRDFGRLADPAVYAPLPADWVVGVADIVRSTDAVENGGYKAVNTVAAAVIAALANALGGRDFPFVFGGDGAGFALPADEAETGRRTLAAVAGWASQAFGFELRIAMVSLEEIRANGRDVRVARFAPTGGAAYAMFDGGGLAFAERRMKQGAYRIAPADGDAARPDLAGLSCRFSPMPAKRGLVLSVIAVPAGEPGAAFAALVHDLLAFAAEGGDGAANPVPAGGPPQHWPTAGFAIEARTAAASTGRPLWLSRLSVGLRSLLAHLTFRSGLRIGDFDPTRYRIELAGNSDFRKFDDGLRMTLDCTPDLADRITARLAAAEAAGIAFAGTHRQEAALMTCFVPVASRSDHLHFVDGAMGGYAAAAAMAFRREARQG
ncbi:DUF3095 family protein [Aurantimonas sp. HBX-1]|uniref:DUF3095 family protein n=1 Tax=Aurantimonas sp. HBX-1 TaxID=2906072 RepID=UPI001F174093|nr:DUF3095 family protein [Aurantimonas sp. HBX-1]UIJ72390.1 DUF3095 domain-containing protein [Aurantimonas sp. HBX-1]